MDIKNFSPDTLRIGDWFQDEITKDKFQVLELTTNAIVFDYLSSATWQAEPILATDAVLDKCVQAKKVKNKIMHMYKIRTPRRHCFHICDPGTPNGFIHFIDKSMDIVTLYNFDFDGPLYVHTLQAIIEPLIKEKLIFNW